MNLQIKPGAALDDAKQIDVIVADITDAMDQLNKIMNDKIGGSGSGKPISTDWGGSVSTNWSKYYSSDIPQTMEEMKLSATNLRKAVEAFLQYSKSE